MRCVDFGISLRCVDFWCFIEFHCVVLVFSVSLNFVALFHCVDVVGIVWGCFALLLVCV